MVTDYEHGGYNLDDSEIGTLVMIVGIIQLFYQVHTFNDSIVIAIIVICACPLAYCVPAAG